MQSFPAAAWYIVVSVCFCTAVQGCTVLGFTNHSFSANVVRLLHSLPIFEGQNGTVYLDSTASSHKCHADGGLHEFFNLGRHAGKFEQPCDHCCYAGCSPITVMQGDRKLSDRPVSPQTPAVSSVCGSGGTVCSIRQCAVSHLSIICDERRLLCAVPWTLEAEAGEPSMCARYSLGDIDNVVHESGLSWDELVQISMRRVC